MIKNAYLACRIWAHFKTVWFLKICSTVQKLFNVEKWLHKNNVKRGNFQHWITFVPLNKISKTKLFLNPPTCGKQVIIFNYLIILCILIIYTPFNQRGHTAKSKRSGNGNIEGRDVKFAVRAREKEWK